MSGRRWCDALQQHDVSDRATCVWHFKSSQALKQAHSDVDPKASLMPHFCSSYSDENENEKSPRLPE